MCVYIRKRPLSGAHSTEMLDIQQCDLFQLLLSNFWNTVEKLKLFFSQSFLAGKKGVQSSGLLGCLGPMQIQCKIQNLWPHGLTKIRALAATGPL